MTPKPLSKIKRFSRLGKIFKTRTRNGSVDSGADASTPEEASQNPQPNTNLTSSILDSSLPSASESASQGSTTASLADNPTSTANTPEPVAVRVETVDQSEAAKISLWDRAYDSLREKDEQLVEEYEELLSRELQSNTGSNNDTPIDGHNNADESPIKSENQIDSSNRKIRLAQLETITSSGLGQLDEKKARYFIFGHEFILRDQLAQATQFIQNIKGVIDEAVKASPPASLAWAGVCVILPIFMNPSVAEEVSRDGCLYVISRIRFYVKLESLLSSSNRMQASGLHAELEDRLIALYRQIIDFQIRTVRRVYLTRLARLAEDTVRHEDWKGMLARIQESEKTFSDDFKQVNDAAMGRELEELNSNAERFFADITSVLAALLKDNRKASTFSFQNHGSGSQFNATGGTQNNITGSGIQFSGVNFRAPVNFGGKGM
ncbi:hypothetical protein PT974_07231 [Cladobotryum mycophilum]|uniref:NWD NACHT-NTPase N-terminal domain-containing protein n=1 Tax=Cladobotryum mycophilum TaxID=491253 RepID=A0ABR0SNX4_9HYPO